MRLLEGKIAIVTGGTKGIGLDIAKGLAKEGCSIVLNYSNDDISAERALNQIKDLGAYAIAFKGDISKYNKAKELIDNTIGTFGKIDILINNAGISKVGLFIDMDEKDWDEIININLKGMFNTSHSAVKHMISQKSGNIINISSIWGNVGASCEVIYSTSKGGVNSFTKALAKELAPSNIRVNAIAPGVINTKMNSWLSEEERCSLEDEIPLSRFGEGYEIANMVCFLCSDKCGYITGQVITVDGGML